TSLWIDPETGTFVVILTSRLHPDGKAPAPSTLRFEVATLAAATITDASPRPIPAPIPPSPTPTPSPAGSSRIARAADEGDIHPGHCGIDVLVQDGCRRLRNRRAGLVTNQTGRTRGGASTIVVLFRAPGVKLVKLFSPEHGIRGERDAAVPDSRDEAT